MSTFIDPIFIFSICSSVWIFLQTWIRQIELLKNIDDVIRRYKSTYRYRDLIGKMWLYKYLLVLRFSDPVQ